jgi:Staygreen protein
VIANSISDSTVDASDTERSVRRLRPSQTCSLSWDPPRFNAEKLSVRYLDGSSGPTTGAMSPGGHLRRRYTLTHNDLTGELTLSVGREYNAQQVTGWCVSLPTCCCEVSWSFLTCPLLLHSRYTRLLRDEVLAEWAGGSLHVHVHIRGTVDWWLAPAQLRSFIFRREMPLVLDTVSFAERQFLATQPALVDAPVLVHFHSGGHTDIESWGCLSCLRSAGVSVSENQRRLAHACSPPVESQSLLLRALDEGPAPTPLRSSAPAPWQTSRGARPNLAPVAATAQHRAVGSGDGEVLVGTWSRQLPRSSGAVRTRTTG